MSFSSQSPLSLLPCTRCTRTGVVGFSRCPECKGMGVAHQFEHEVIYLGMPFTRYAIALRRGRKKLNIVRIVCAIALSALFILLFFLFVSSRGLLSRIDRIDFWSAPNQYHLFLLLALYPLFYIWYRILLSRTPGKEISYNKKRSQGSLEKRASVSQWSDVHGVKHSDRVRIAALLSDSSESVLERAFVYALQKRAQEVDPFFLFRALLEVPEIQGMFVRLGIPAKALSAKMAQYQPQKQSQADPELGEDAMQILFHAYHEARSHHGRHIECADLFVTTIRQSEALQELLYDLEVDEHALTNVVAWVRIQQSISDRFHAMQRTGASRNKYGLDRAMTAVATPFLNAYSQDVTRSAAMGRLEPCVAREKEIDEIFRAIEGGRSGVLLVGDHGVGKSTIISGIAQRMVAEDVPDRLKDKRLIQLSTSALVAGTTISGAQERLMHMMREVHRAGNIILFINNLHDLVGTSGDQAGLDISETLAEHLSRGDALTLATTTLEGYNTSIINTQVGQVFSRINVNEMDEDQAIQALESKAGLIEYQQRIFFSYAAIAKAVSFAKRFLHDQHLPESAVLVATEAASYVRNERGEKNLVLAEDVAHIVSDKTGIPTTSIGDDESTKLLKLEEAMHKRVIGQEEAVVLVANALRRARAEIRSKKRPIANFLFLGPTGVGKTELAKTIASVYFGGEERMVRIDMSEYQDESSIYRLIGQPGQKGTGMLTEAVRQQPFSLVLLDEMEKADPNILNLFLQVFDDGRLTDSVGRVIDFTNTIIIATSNAGTSYVQDQLNKGVALEDIRQTLIRGELKQYYRPEFLNRFDGIVLFRALERDQIKQIANLMLMSIGHALEQERGVFLKVTDGALEALAKVGFDPEFGARPMRRAIQDHVQNGLAEMILSGKLKRRDTIVLGDELTLSIE